MTSHIFEKSADDSVFSDYKDEKASTSQAYDDQLESVFRGIDSVFIKWTWMYAILFCIAIFSLLLFSASLFMGTHYMIAISCGLFLMASLGFFSFALYCRDEFFSITTNAQNSCCTIFDMKNRGNAQYIAEDFLKAGSRIKKRWRYTPPQHQSVYHRFVYSPGYRLISQFMWIPYFLIGEIFFHAAKSCYIGLLRESPKNLELHAGLANTYVMLSTHLKEAISMKDHLSILSRCIPKRFFIKLQERRAIASRRAIQELTILRSFSPDELWILDQLAISYRELGLIQEEMEVYRAILVINNDDTNALFRLGILSFQKGDNARGLEMYDQLLYLQPLLAHELIASFGSYDEHLSINTTTTLTSV